MRLNQVVRAITFVALISSIEHAQTKPDATSTPIRFRDIATAAGLTTKPHSTDDRKYVIETMAGGGVALLDCDNDGKLDIAVVNDSTIDAYLKGGEPMLTLYHQDGTGSKIHFTDITKSAGLRTRGWGTAVAVADFDNDGLLDIFVSGYGHNVLYRNLGKCRFEDITAKAGLEGGGFSTGAAWVDYDRDGFVDLFVARYVETDVHHLPPPDKSFSYRGVLVELPDRMPGESDLLYRNRGDGTFEEVSSKAGLNDPYKLHGMGCVWGDYDGDGWPDLFVTNDAGWNFLYHNKRDGTFDEIGVLSGTGLGPNGERYGNMAADFGDFDRDGKLDLVVTRYGDQPASLYRNMGNDQFVDVAAKAGIASDTFVPIKWGVGFGDFDDDGWPDILMANGNFSKLMDTLPYDARYAERMQLFHNQRGVFKEVAKDSGINAGPFLSRRGTALGDVKNDGELDAVVFNVNHPPSLFLNETATKNHRVEFQLVGTKSNRAAIGARVTVTTKALVQVDEVRAGGSYNSSNDLRLHFGLGDTPTMNEVEIRWPSGLVQKFHELAADALYRIVEGQDPKKLLLFREQAQSPRALRR